LLERARSFRDANVTECGTIESFENHWDESNENPGWLITPWAGSRIEEEKLSKQFKISVRCLPLDKQNEPEAPCFLSGKPTKSRAIWARSY